MTDQPDFTKESRSTVEGHDLIFRLDEAAANLRAEAGHSFTGTVYKVRIKHTTLTAAAALLEEARNALEDR